VLSGAFMDAVDDMRFDFIASGHYAKVIHASTWHAPSLLELSRDMVGI
jgi:tRNA-5-taurinomethyluridine 2-sulfurtransferase